MRFLGTPLSDPWATAGAWSDSVLQALYDAVHAAALTTAGATSLMHEAKVDIVTVPNLYERLGSRRTLHARFPCCRIVQVPLHHHPCHSENTMSKDNVESSPSDFHPYFEYARDNPHPKFTGPQLEYIRSIDDILTPQEVDAVSSVESFEIGLLDGEVSCREVPGLRPRYGNTVVYIQRYSDERFAAFMEKVIDHIAAGPQGPEMFLRYIIPVRIIIPDVGIFYPLTYGVGALQWRNKVRRRMAEVGALTGEFVNGKFNISDGRVFPVSAMQIERSRYSGRGYAPEW